MIKILHSCFTLSLILLLSGCSALIVRNPLPENLSHYATVLDIKKARMWGDESPDYIERWLKQSKDEIKTNFPAIYASHHNYLALSGGGADGAYGAGLLAGWLVTKR